MAGNVTGIVFVKVDGTLLRSKEGASIDMGGKTRTPVIGYKVYGPAEKVAPAVVTFTLAHMAGDDLLGLAAKIDSTVEFSTDTGDSYIVSDGFCTKTPVLTGGEGDVEFEFQGQPATKA